MLRRRWVLLLLPIVLFGSVFAATLGNWQSLGPTNIADSIVSLAYKPDNANVLLAISFEGTLWLTTDGGASWSVPASAPQGATTPVRFDPNNPNIVYVGGPGILYKSVDGGSTWTYEILYQSEFQYFTDFVISKANPNHIYVPTYAGVMRSIDGGAGWQALSVTGSNFGQNCDSLAMRSDVATDVVFVDCRNGVYRNTDAAGNGTWELVLTEPGMGSAVVAIAPSNQDVVYVLSVETDNTKPYYRG